MINLHFSDGNVYVWSEEDWAILRRNRIVGQLIGQLTHIPRQNVFKGLPLVLLKEETTLLLNKGLAAIKDYPALRVKPSEEEKTAYDNYVEADFSLQVSKYKEKRTKEIKDKIDIIMKGKKKGKKKKKGGKGNIIVDHKNIDQNTILNEEINKINILQKKDVEVKIYTAHPWFGKTLSQVENSVKLLNWDYPKTKLEITKYKVYEHLWEKGLYLTPGLKFGGDFLAYPGDPLKYHSHFIVICKEYNSGIHATDLISLVRLGNTVRKTIVIAYLDDNDKLFLYSLCWPGISL